jgi:site-specific DNA recombinase
MLKRGIADEDFDDVKNEMSSLRTRKLDLLQRIETTNDPPPLLHPNMANLWREQITELRDALAEDRCNPEAREAVRQMVEEIRLTPRDGVLAVEVKGNLAAMLSAASPTEDWPRELALVAGACNRYLQLSHSTT